MPRVRLVLTIVLGVVLGSAALGPAQQSQPGPGVGHPYASFFPRVETRLRFVSDFAFPGGPAFQVKVYDWIIGPRQDFPVFPLEGFATIEVIAGEAETTVDGVTAVRREGEHWVVPEGAKLGISVKSDTGRGDNMVSLHAVVVIRK